MRKTITMTFCVTIVAGLLLTNFVFAEGNARKGKYTYRKVYQSCMDRGEVQSAVPTLSPDAKTQAQWDQFFTDKKYLEMECKTEWSALSPEDIENIHAYLRDHAADSPTPAKCK